jgi:hypothetical protein
MIQKRLHLVPVFAALVFAVAVASASAAVKAGSQVYYGLVKHVSTTDLKVYDPKTKKTMGFVLVPRFGNVFKSDGRTPSALNNISAGDYVKVYYDQKFLGAFHADRILILSQHNHVVTKTHG